MQGGHYTAYIKTRTPLQCDQDTLSSLTHRSETVAACSSNPISDSTEDACSKNVETESKQLMSDKNGSTSNSCDTVKEVDKTVCETTVNKSVDKAATNDQPNMIDSEKETQCMNTNTGHSKNASVSKFLNFDPSVTNGHWYYVSDSHVKAASESEVLRCQAYLLFYERLPLQ